MLIFVTNNRFDCLVEASTYSRRFRRKRIDTDDGRRYLFATIEDNLDAWSLYETFSDSQNLKMPPPRYRKILDIMPDGMELTLEELTERYNSTYKKKPISSKSMYNRLLELAKRDFVTTSKRREPRGEEGGYPGGERGETNYFYAKIPNLPNSSQLKVGIRNPANLKLLDRELNLIVSGFPKIPER